MGEARRKSIYRAVQEMNLAANNERAAEFSAKWRRSEAAKRGAETRRRNKLAADCGMMTC